MDQTYVCVHVSLRAPASLEPLNWQTWVHVCFQWHCDAELPVQILNNVVYLFTSEVLTNSWNSSIICIDYGLCVCVCVYTTLHSINPSHLKTKLMICSSPIAVLIILVLISRCWRCVFSNPDPDIYPGMFNLIMFSCLILQGAKCSCWSVLFSPGFSGAFWS